VLRLWLRRTREQAQRYERSFGRGAIVFARGQHAELAQLLASEAVILDASLLGGSGVLAQPADVVIRRPSRRWSRRELRSYAPRRELRSYAPGKARAKAKSPDGTFGSQD